MSMLDNHVYNLMNQMVQEHKSLYKIKEHYSEDAGSCGQCQDFWKKMIQDKEDHIAELERMIKEHLS